MREYIEIGATPYDEDCAQVGSDDYQSRARKECGVYVRQLWRILEEKKGMNGDNAPTSFNLVVKSYPHDFGTYHEVVARFSDINADAADLAYWVEENAPANWDETAKEELGL